MACNQIINIRQLEVEAEVAVHNPYWKEVIINENEPYIRYNIE